METKSITGATVRVTREQMDNLCNSLVETVYTRDGGDDVMIDTCFFEPWDWDEDSMFLVFLEAMGVSLADKEAVFEWQFLFTHHRVLILWP